MTPNPQKGMQSVFRVPIKSIHRVAAVVPNAKAVVHPRRSHKKSRSGCRTCKQRRVKCDENRDGGCLKCRNHGLDCDYIKSYPQEKGRILLPKNQALTRDSGSSTDSPTGSLVKGGSSTCFSPLSLALYPKPSFVVELPEKMTPVLQTLHHFDTVTYCSMGSDMGQQIIKACFSNHVFENAYLMHAVSGVSAAHLCHLLPVAQHPVQHGQSKLAEAYHWQKALRLFRDELSSGVGQHNMDALMSTMMLICVHQFMLTEPLSDPGKSFVFAPSEQRGERIRWLTIQHGFNVMHGQLGELLWESVWNPVLQDSVVARMTPAAMCLEAGDEIHALFLDLCEITSTSSLDDNPYTEALEFMLFLRRLKPNMNNFNKLVTFVAAIEGRYLELLLGLDKRALLILAHWLALMGAIQQWWISGRSRAECLAIVTFLMHDQDERVKKLLEYPAKTVGLSFV